MLAQYQHLDYCSRVGHFCRTDSGAHVCHQVQKLQRHLVCPDFGPVCHLSTCDPRETQATHVDQVLID